MTFLIFGKSEITFKRQILGYFLQNMILVNGGHGS